jgi:hypothetical protein
MEINQPNDISTTVDLQYLSAQVAQLRSDVALQTQKLADLSKAIEELPEAEAWSDQRVRIADFDIPFGHMIGFMVKAAIASIPAAIIFFILVFIVISLFGGTLLASLLRMPR